MSGGRGGYARLPNHEIDGAERYPPRPSKQVFQATSDNDAYDERMQKLIIRGAVASCVFLLALLFSCWPLGESGSFDLISQLLAGPTWTIINVSESSANVALPPYKSESVLAQRLLSPACAEMWIAKGELCAELHGRVGKGTEKSLDIVWTWVNGSSSLLADWRKALLHNEEPPGLMQPPPDRRGVLKHPHADPGSAAHHFRQHNELLFSMRSTLSIPDALVKSRVLITADLPTSDPSKRTAQSPAWLNSSSSVRLRHHWHLFRTRAADDPGAWRTDALPTFNSLAIESQLGHLDSAETILYMNDDSFVANPMQAADLATPLFGPVFRMQQDLLVKGRGEHQRGDDLEGEWPSLGYSNSILERRFGKRPRPYATHVSKVLSRPILLEMEAVFGHEFARTGSSRFRGRQVDMHVSFAVLHYMIEKHREVLLWSFVFGRRLGVQGTIELLKQALAPTAVQSGTKLDIAWPNRTTLDPNVTLGLLDLAGFEAPQTTQVQFSSADAYAIVELDPQRIRETPHAGAGKGMGVSGNPPSPGPADSFDRWPDYRWRPSRGNVGCQIDLEICFPTRFRDDADALFRHVAFQEPKCGDCLIVALLHLSGEKGLEAFLPPASTFEYDAVDPPTPGGLASTWQEAVYLPPLSRLDVVRLLQRYSYMIGMSWSQFLNVRSISGLPVLLGRLQTAMRREPHPAFVVINDDIKLSNALPGVDRALLNFFTSSWPQQGPWEYEYHET